MLWGNVIKLNHNFSPMALPKNKNKLSQDECPIDTSNNTRETALIISSNAYEHAIKSLLF